jgi:hypothetical protein
MCLLYFPTSLIGESIIFCRTMLIGSNPMVGLGSPTQENQARYDFLP